MITNKEVNKRMTKWTIERLKGRARGCRESAIKFRALAESFESEQREYENILLDFEYLFCKKAVQP